MNRDIASGIRSMGRRWELQLPKCKPIKDQQKFPPMQLQGKPGRILTLCSPEDQIDEVPVCGSASAPPLSSTPTN